jgi:hypothetical protein
VPGKPASGVVNATQLAPIQSGGSQGGSQMPDQMDMDDYDMDGMPQQRQPRMPAFDEEEYDDEEEDAVADDGDQALTYEDFENIINTEGTTNSDTTELRKANFIRKGTAAHAITLAIKTGDQAISFFAKHGTNMPIKFLNCNRRPVPPSEYRPYELVVVLNEKQLDNEYYTISAQGVVQVQNDKNRKKKRAGGTAPVKPNGAVPTEFLSLSDWMQQQTMFNVLTSMNFFKNYLIGKVFGLWKGNVRYRTYTKTRLKLSQALIQSRPDYQPTFMDINRILYDMQCKTTYQVQKSQKNYEIEDFNQDQQKHRGDTKTHYNEQVQQIIETKLTNLIAAIQKSRTQPEQEDMENTKIGQATKNKSMVV